MRFGIMSAMQEENHLLLAELDINRRISCAQRGYITGSLWNQDAVVVFSRWGKVAAAMTATHLIVDFKVDAIIFTGVAGSCSQNVHIGDIVIANSLIQHDMDARPLFPQHEIPLLGQKEFIMHEHYTHHAYQNASTFLQQTFSSLPEQERRFFNITSPQVHQGLIASGDKFFAS